MPKIRVLIADDHALVRAGLSALLAAQPDIEVVGEAANGAEAVEQCRRLAPDVVLLDLTMPGRGGIGALRELREVCPTARVLVVSMHDDEPFVRQAMLAGAAGYLLKKAVANELISGTRMVARGRQYISSSLVSALVETEGTGPAVPVETNPDILGRLTPREREVVNLVALGHTNVEVATRLDITERTAEAHRLRIMSKLGLRTRAELVRFAIEYGLVHI